MSSSRPMRDGMPLKYQMWLHGRGQFNVAHALAANLALGDLDAAAVADFALVADLLYFPQWHSQSFVGPKMRSQKRPSRSGLSVR